MGRREDVSAFHRAMGQPVHEGAPRELEEGRMRMRLKLIKEEFFELLAACEIWPKFGLADGGEMRVEEMIDDAIDCDFAGHVNLVEVADALADLDYVVEGCRVEMGIDGEAIHDEVHRSNMAKLGPDGKPLMREDGKITKPDGWTPPDIAGVLAKMRSKYRPGIPLVEGAGTPLRHPKHRGGA